MKASVRIHYNYKEPWPEEIPESFLSMHRSEVFRSLHLNTPLKSKKALSIASKKLMYKVGNIPVGHYKFGVILASEATNLYAHNIVSEEYKKRLKSGPQHAFDEFYKVIQGFPEATDLILLGNLWAALGPQMNIYGNDLDCLYPYAQLLFEANRVDQLLLCAIQSIDDDEVIVRMEYIERPSPAINSGKSYLGPGLTLPIEKGDSATTLAIRLLSAFLKKHPLIPRETPLIFSTFLGTNVQIAYHNMMGLPAPEDFRYTLKTYAEDLGFNEVHFVCGTSGASLSSLMIASDIISLGKAENVIICSTDVIQGPMNEALYLLDCPDRLQIGEGGACCLLTSHKTKKGFLDIIQFSPNLNKKNPEKLDTQNSYFEKIRAIKNLEIVISGLNNVDIKNAIFFAKLLWPDSTLDIKKTGRLQATDVLYNLVATQQPKATFCVNYFGGSGAVIPASLHNKTIQIKGR